MSTAIAFTVYGKSETKGSSKSMISHTTGRIITMNDNVRADGWQMRIGIEASIAMRAHKQLAGPVELAVRFYLPRPTKLPKRVHHHITKPDLDKLIRCAKDAMTGIVWRDDAQVVTGDLGKFYAGWVFDPLGASGVPRAEIRVRTAADAGGTS